MIEINLLDPAVGKQYSDEFMAENEGVTLVPTAKDAQLVLGVIGGHGLPKPGSFMTLLVETMIHADIPNLTKLSRGFRQLAIAVYLYRYVVGGYEGLCTLAGVEPDRDMVPQIGRRDG